MAESEVPHAKPGLICHRHGKDVSETCHVCPLWMKIEEKSVDTNKNVHVHTRYECADVAMPQVFAALAREIRGMAAEVEEARKEVGESTEAIRVMQDKDHKIMAAQVLGKVTEAASIITHARMTEKLIGRG